VQGNGQPAFCGLAILFTKGEGRFVFLAFLGRSAEKEKESVGKGRKLVVR